MAERTFDVVVIGAGPAGEVAAGRLGQGGLSVALVEKHLVGGECSYYACMPSKALLRPGDLLAETKRVPGIRTDGLDVPAVLTRRDEVIHELDDSGQLPWLEERGVELVRGDARFDGERRVAVGEDVLLAAKAVIVATGSGPVMPPIPGLAEAKPWGNREATTAKTAPETLVILGGGVVGVELAQAWTSLGTEVILLEGAPRVIVREEPFASAEVEAALREAGVDVRTNCRAVSVARDGDVTVTMEDGSTATGAELLVAVGRKPNTENLGLETIGLEPGQAGRGRLEPALVQTRLAVRDRRCERPRAAHAHGQVPGPACGGRDSRPERDARLRRPALAARDLHRPAGRRSRPHARIGGGGGDGGAGSRRRDELDRGCELRRPRCARNLAARHRRRASRHRRGDVHGG